MNSRFAILLMALMQAACVSAPDPRPEVVTRGEYTLQQGLHAFNADDYLAAAAQFRNALLLYLGLDDLDGVVRSRINLAETALAVDNLQMAERQITALERLLMESALSIYQPRVILLTASLTYKQGQLDRAIEILEPLLVELQTAERQGDAALLLAVVASRTRIALAQGAAVDQWLETLAAVTERSTSAISRAQLARLNGEWALRQGLLLEAGQQLDIALSGYKGVQNRRGIAATLRLQAGLAIAEQRWLDAERLLYRALGVSSQLLDRHAAAALLGQLVSVERVLDRSDQIATLERLQQRLGEAGFSDWQSLNRLQ